MKFVFLMPWNCSGMFNMYQLSRRKHVVASISLRQHETIINGSNRISLMSALPKSRQSFCDTPFICGTTIDSVPSSALVYMAHISMATTNIHDLVVECCTAPKIYGFQKKCWVTFTTFRFGLCVHFNLDCGYISMYLLSSNFYF